MSMFKSVAAVGSLTFVSRIFGYIRDVLIGSIFGDSGISDVFFQAFRLPNIFRSLFAEGALNSAFVPIFSRIHHQEGSKSALDFARDVFTFLAILLTILIVIFEVFMPTVIGVLAPGFKSNPEKFQMAIEFGHIVFPYILFISLSALCAGILNSLNQFAAATAAPILLNLFCIFALMFFAAHQDTAGYALSWGCMFAGIAQLAWVMIACRRINMPLKLRKIEFTPQLKTLLKKMGPGIASSGVYQINLVVSTMIASYVPLAVSYLAWADRINQFPLSIIGIAIGTVLLPLLTRQLASGKHERASHVQNRVLQFSFSLTLPAAIAFYTISLPIVITLFQHGHFTAAMSKEVACVLSIYSLCLPSNVMVKIFATSFFSRGNTETPMKVALISIGTNLVFTLILFQFFSYYGIAWAAVISSWTNSLSLGFLLHKKGFFTPDQGLRKKLPRIVLAAFMMGGFLHFITSYVVPYLGRSILVDFLLLVALMITGFSIYLFLVVMFKGFVYQEFKKELKDSSDEQLIDELIKVELK
ncbi:MAG: murein biosynthesis integral membrane protein MurJ [Alphaproteobacteria bacterium]